MINWDDKFAADEHFYGTLANDFLREQLAAIPKGKALSLGEGEGRNAIYMIEQGFEVTALDNSARGLEKTRKFAESRGLSVKTIHANLLDVDLGEAQYDLIISIFCHMPNEVRKIAHEKSVRALKTGGYLLLEAYTPKQVELGTGGPKAEDLLLTVEKLKEEFTALQFISVQELYREIHEGAGHNGRSHVVQLIAQKIG